MKYLRYLVRAFAVFGFLVMLAFLSTMLWVRTQLTALPELPDSVVLEYTLDEELLEKREDAPLTGALFGLKPSLRDVVAALDQGAVDKRVKGLVLHIGDPEIGLAQVQELRDAVQRFRKAGKFTVAFAESYGEFAPGHKPYYLATAFEQVWIQPVGTLGLTNLVAEVPFAREALDNLGVLPQIGQRKEFKTAFDSLTQKGLTPANREQLQSMLDDLSGQLREGIANARGITPEKVAALVNFGPFLAEEALAAGLVNRIGYYDEALEETFQKTDGKGSIDLLDYLHYRGEPAKDTPKVALIYITGMIMRGEAKLDPMSGGEGTGSTDISQAFDDAVADKSVRAIVLRVDSGGGSPSASETIRRAVIRAKEAGKPVIVSMGNAAASGGYWVAMSADRIIAQPGTLTGSIGVLAGKVATDALWGKIGVNWERVGGGPNATMWSFTEPYSDYERTRLDAMLDSTYTTFVNGVAQARNLPVERVQEIAKGRVWTGRQAKDLGLVDELGGLDTALRAARRAINLPEEGPTTLALFPMPKGPLEEALSLLENFGLQSRLIGKGLSAAEPFLNVAAGLREQGQTGAVSPFRDTLLR